MHDRPLHSSPPWHSARGYATLSLPAAMQGRDQVVVQDAAVGHHLPQRLIVLFASASRQEEG
jgi:hypothetical protein